jgi:hypothetical protein
MERRGRVLCGHQPNFLPWLGLFYKVKQADVLRVADHVRFSRSWTNRTRIKDRAGRPTWVTVPINAADASRPIAEVRVAGDQAWRDRALGRIQDAYRHAACFRELDDVRASIERFDGELLVDLNMRLLALCLDGLGIETPVVMGTSLELQPGKSMHIIDSCRRLACDTYLAGQGAAYLDEALFVEHGITLRRSDFVHPVYEQAEGSFMPGLSVIDAVANIGWDRTASLLEAQP